MISCGHCKQKHGTVQEVRECSLTRPMIPEALLVKVETLSEGFYQVDDDHIYKVVASQTGRLYAKVLVADQGKHGWEYAPGAVREIRSEHRMTREQAAQYGRLTGVCVVCGRRLTNEVSVENGIGPICASRF